MSTVITPEILEQALGQYFGIAPDQVKSTFERMASAADSVEELQPMVLSQWRERELSTLRESWGEEFDDVYKYITEEVFPNLPPQEQAKWNNADGLKFLAEKNRSTIEARLSSKETPSLPAATPEQNNATAGTIAPANNTGSTVKSSALSFKQSQLLNMTPEEWKANESAIQQAYATGAVEMDVE